MWFLTFCDGWNGGSSLINDDDHAHSSTPSSTQVNYEASLISIGLNMDQPIVMEGRAFIVGLGRESVKFGPPYNPIYSIVHAVLDHFDVLFVYHF